MPRFSKNRFSFNKSNMKSQGREETKGYDRKEREETNRYDRTALKSKEMKRHYETAKTERETMRECLLSTHNLQTFFQEPLNRMQSECVDCLLCSSKSMLVSAPTGSGKTLLLELSVIRLIRQDPFNKFRCVYLCPLNALCQ